MRAHDFMQPRFPVINAALIQCLRAAGRQLLPC